MKQMYKCERCGALYDDYAECEQCENGHFDYGIGFDWDDTEDFKNNVRKHTKYKEGNPTPEEIAVMLFHEYYDSEKSVWTKEREIGIYKLKCTMPIGTKD